MGTEILKSFGTLQSELDQARSTLKCVDEDIKRLIGRDPAELFRPGLKRALPPQIEEYRGRIVIAANNARGRKEPEPPTKRRGSVFDRLSDRPIKREEEQLQQQKHLISKVIVTPREVPSRQEALAKQGKDEKSKARNRRMFGALLGQLQKFQQEETKLKSKEQKRAEVEKKIEETEIREKAEIKKERQELFFNRKRKQAEIKMIEMKMLRMREYAAWEERQKLRRHFILTKAKPAIQYLPRRLNPASRELLEACRSDIDQLIEKRKEEVNGELQNIEDRMKRNFEPRVAQDQTDDTSKENDEASATDANGVEQSNENGVDADDLKVAEETTTVEASEAKEEDDGGPPQRTSDSD